MSTAWLPGPAGAKNTPFGVRRVILSGGFVQIELWQGGMGCIIRREIKFLFFAEFSGYNSGNLRKFIFDLFDGRPRFQVKQKNGDYLCFVVKDRQLLGNF